MSVKLLAEQRSEFLSLKGDCTGSSESTLVKIPHCWKSHVPAHIFLKCLCQLYVVVVTNKLYGFIYQITCVVLGRKE